MNIYFFWHIFRIISTRFSFNHLVEKYFKRLICILQYTLYPGIIVYYTIYRVLCKHFPSTIGISNEISYTVYDAQFYTIFLFFFHIQFSIIFYFPNNEKKNSKFFLFFVTLWFRRYHDNKMVNYDIQDGFSVSSFHAPHNHHNNGVSSSSSSPISSSSISSGNHDGSSLNSTPSTAPSIPQTTFLKVPSTSVLTIQEVHFKHAGNYTCAPSNARQTSITVHVLRGELKNFYFIFFVRR